MENFMEYTSSLGLFAKRAAFAVSAGLLLTAIPVKAAEPLPQDRVPLVFDASYYASRYPDLSAAFGTDAEKLYGHFLSDGMEEGRQGSVYFNLEYYKSHYPDLVSAFGDDNEAYYAHFAETGSLEGRFGAEDTAASMGLIAYNTSYGEYCVDILRYAIEERAKAGVCTLTLDPALCRVAEVRTAECAQAYSHTRPDGRSFHTAAQDAGVPFHVIGENLGMGYKTGYRAVMGWMGSPRHKENMLDPRFTRIGVSAVLTERAWDGKTTWFCAQELAD